jgi:hypothetical protein
MKIFITFITLILTSCYVEVSPPPPIPDPIPLPMPIPDSYCGDGICDEWDGEDAWNCVDCGYDPLTGGPRDGGFCGDGRCFSNEDMWSCCSDCCPNPIDPEYNYLDPGYIDPMPEQKKQAR